MADRSAHLYYLMIFHASRKGGEQKYFDAHASLGMAWSEDFVNWSWPGRGLVRTGATR